MSQKGTRAQGLINVLSLVLLVFSTGIALTALFGDEWESLRIVTASGGTDLARGLWSVCDKKTNLCVPIDEGDGYCALHHTEFLRTRRNDKRIVRREPVRSVETVHIVPVVYRAASSSANTNLKDVHSTRVQGPAVAGVEIGKNVLQGHLTGDSGSTTGDINIFDHGDNTKITTDDKEDECVKHIKIVKISRVFLILSVVLGTVASMLSAYTLSSRHTQILRAAMLANTLQNVFILVTMVVISLHTIAGHGTTWQYGYAFYIGWFAWGTSLIAILVNTLIFPTTTPVSQNCTSADWYVPLTLFVK
ncbi:hypothetical protein SARC_10271 [Sphaeroforma arctica JP610]|uniref:Uncharacterized protein n=1 Tax=Sphaeroforma arctica JP610 TaxID=667725 RepID=A0A0L0FKF8_9EUKA|nr:hypothetical protein SARC_10271 [Sphaeroforma arctica JP610]KNC77262.1 hypothetical protein SARC_10271 [Sphaeroforma arctica JP610]|eukprot:XP_014151164.1 hypothetical protein SARC_10271 [Sphaeroforma arctica JP610]